MRNISALSAVVVFGLLACANEVEPTAPGNTDQQALAAGAQVLFVVGNATLSTGDVAIRSRLQGLQATVVVRTGVTAQTADATGKVLVVISDSVTSSDVNTKFRDTSVPVLCLENALFDDMRMTAATAGTDFGTTTGQTDLTLTAVSHPIAAGLNVPVVTSGQTFAWGVPAASATRIATLSGNSNRVGIFAYETGAAMVGGSAPGRRIGFFAAGAAPGAFTALGGKLFDNAVQWLTPAGCSSNAQCASPVNGTGVCTAGVCGLQCNTGFHACGGVCVSDNSVSACGLSCSACPTPPNGVATCTSGVCNSACVVGFHLCGGVCVSNNSVTTCGLSCSVCPTPPNGVATCTSGVCNSACVVGFHLCGGVCVSDNSVSACGLSCSACPTPPNGVATCTSGVCNSACVAGFHLCGGVCVSNNSVSTCGLSCSPCPTPPNGVATCTSGVCNSACVVGFHLCGGVCISDNSVSACGLSCSACPTPPNGVATCTSGVCNVACVVGFQLCNGTCIPSGGAC